MGNSESNDCANAPNGVHWQSRPLIVISGTYLLVAVVLYIAVRVAEIVTAVDPVWSRALLFVLFLNGQIAVFVGWTLGHSHSEDRLLFAKVLAWSLGPIVGLTSISGFVFFSGLYTPIVHVAILVLVCSAIVGLVWMLMVSPFLRQFALQNATHPERMKHTIIKTSWPLKSLDEIEELEIKINPKLYYSFLIACLSLFVLVF